jgi:hypothetical protein
MGRNTICKVNELAQFYLILIAMKLQFFKVSSLHSCSYLLAQLEIFPAFSLYCQAECFIDKKLALQKS